MPSKYLSGGLFLQQKSNASKKSDLMGNKKPPDLKWNEWQDGSAQACVAEMSITTLNELAVMLSEHDSPCMAIQSGFTMGVNPTQPDHEEITVDVTMRITYKRKLPRNPILH